MVVLQGDPNISQLQFDVFVRFPDGLIVSLPTEVFTLQINRNPAIFPIAGDQDTGKARFIWIDLGLTQFTLIVQGPIRNIGNTSTRDLEAAFLRSWKASLADTNDNVDTSHLTEITIVDPRNNQLRQFWGICRNFRRVQKGGMVNWEYQLTMDVVIMPCDNEGVASFTDVIPGEEHVGIVFPGVGSTLIPVEELTISDNRTAAVVPLVGNSDTGCPQFFWTDLGLTEIDIQMHGHMSDVQNPDPFEVTAQFLKAWTQSMAGDNQQGDIQAPYIVIGDPQGSIVYRAIPRTLSLTRLGQVSKWDYLMSFSAVDIADLPAP